MTKKLLLFIALLSTFAQGAWAQGNLELSYEQIPNSLGYSDRAFYRFNYPSTSVTGEPVLLSGVIVFWKPASMESKTIETVHLCCHHTFTANSECPSLSLNTSNTEPNTYLATTLTNGSNDYIYLNSIAIMPDYEGFGVSSDRTHPYLAEEVTAQQTVDAMIYGLQVYQQLVDDGNVLPMSDSWRSFTIGYSQGGAVALATHRYIEQHNLCDELHFRGSFCGDGPYDLIATLRYYMEDNGNSYGVGTAHRAGQATLPAVIPMIMNGMMISDPNVGNHSMSDYLSKQFLDTGILDWLNGKTMTLQQIADAWWGQLANGFTASDGTTYTHEQMAEMFIDKTSGGTHTVWVNLSKVFTPGFYNYLSNPDNFTSVPTATGNPYQDMHRALANNGICTGWNPIHRIHFKHSKKDTVVPYGNYLAFRDTHEGEGTRYNIDNTFSSEDHQVAGFGFFLFLPLWLGEFQWLESPIEWLGSGTVDDPYLITNATEWQFLADSVSGGKTYSDKYFQLGADISVSNMVGADDDNSFRGTFDGNGHTLTFNNGTAENPFNEEYCAPFRHVKNATIKNLHVDGTIYTSVKKAAGFVGESHGALTLTGCRSSVAINSSKSGDGTHGGFVATLSGADNTIIIDGCLFDGSFATTAGTIGCGGFIGWPVYNRPVISNSLMKPSSVDAEMLGGTFCRVYYEPTITNCYFIATTNLPTNQGKQVYSITGGAGVTVANAGIATEYNVSGITGYDTGIKYNDVLIAGNGDNVNLNLNCIATSSVEYYASTGSLTGSANPYTFTMPDTDVVVNVKAQLSISNGKWYVISTPMHDQGETFESISQVENLTGDSYDLFRYSETEAKWENQKAGDGATGFDNLAIGRGYIYRCSDDRTLTFSGELNSAETYSITLTATDAAGELKGFNLIGNPYPFRVHLNRDYLTLNPDGTVSEHYLPHSDSLEVGQGALVYTATGEILTFYASTRSTNVGATRLPPLPKGIFLNENDNENEVAQANNSPFAYISGNQLIIEGTGTLQIFDIMGRELFRENVSTNQQINVSTFPQAGVYILRLDGQSQKIIIR